MRSQPKNRQLLKPDAAPWGDSSFIYATQQPFLTFGPAADNKHPQKEVNNKNHSRAGEHWSLDYKVGVIIIIHLKMSLHFVLNPNIKCSNKNINIVVK